MNHIPEAPYLYVDTGPALRKLVSVLRGTDRVALDIEADSLHHYFEKVCLIQLTIDSANYLSLIHI